jgi:dipeptidyl aminopeptidase/acylaminoacyl peptidase
LGYAPPAVVRVHGGPSAQTRPYFSPEAQLLAGRGFLVVAPNYRGSSGYGRAFEDLNNKDWGGGDLRDLIAVVDALAARGDLDRTRVGITGGSYGGYMILRAITATPTAWAAAVESYGMPDLIADYRINSDRFGSWYETRWGRQRRTRCSSRIARRSSTLKRSSHRSSFSRGANDSNVPKWESDLDVDALQKHGRVVDYVVYPNEGHGFTHCENRLDAMQRTAEFFGQHLAVRVRPETAR